MQRARGGTGTSAVRLRRHENLNAVPWCSAGSRSLAGAGGGAWFKAAAERAPRAGARWRAVGRSESRVPRPGLASPLCPRHGFPQLPGRREEGGEGEEYPGGGAVQVGAAARSRGPRGAGEVPPLQSLWDRSETFTALSLGEPGGPGPPSWGGRGLEGRRAASGSGEMELRGVFASTSLPRSPPCHPTAHVTAP